jgi:hypothetical protein
MDLKKIISEIQDCLTPILDTYEQAIYHYIFRHTVLNDKREMYFSTRSAEIGFGSGNSSSKPSMSTRSTKLRTLEKKGAIKIISRSNKGIKVQINLPHEIKGLITEEIETKINLNELNFYKDKKLLPVILKREGYRCFYTGRKIDENSCFLDHVLPKSSGGTDCYKNIVATCYDANSMKNDKDVDDFIRELYQEGLVNLEQLKQLKEKINKLKKGEIIPDVKLIDEIYC